MGSTLSSPATEKNSESGEDARFAYGVTEMQGWRVTMEDAHAVALRLDEGEETNSFFAVYDGHGGGTVAKFAGQNVHQRLVKEESYREQRYEEAMKQAFLGTDEDILADPATAKDPSGCTAVAALITKENKIYVANAGDSRVVISVKGQVKALSDDHKPQNATESARIQAAGGYVEYGRVNGNLALSRAIGDFQYKKNLSIPPENQIITSNPEIMIHDITEEEEFLVLACDGIWDCLSSQQVVDVVRLQAAEGTPLPEICENICELCLSPDTSSGAGFGCDNMTIMIVAFLQGQTQQQWYEKIKDRVERKYGYKTPSTLPSLYSQSRLLAFKARRQALQLREERFAEMKRGKEAEKQRNSPFPKKNGRIVETYDWPDGTVLTVTHLGSDSHNDDNSDDELSDENPDTLVERDDWSAGKASGVTKSLKQQLEELERDDDETVKGAGGDDDDTNNIDADADADDGDNDDNINADVDDDELKEPFDSVIDLSQAEQHRAEVEASGAHDSPLSPSSTDTQSPRSTISDSPPTQGEAFPQPQTQLNGTAVPEQLKTVPGDDAPNSSVKAEGFLDSSESPLKG